VFPAANELFAGRPHVLLSLQYHLCPNVSIDVKRPN
jgi:hypothetical protein